MPKCPSRYWSCLAELGQSLDQQHRWLYTIVGDRKRRLKRPWFTWTWGTVLLGFHHHVFYPTHMCCYECIEWHPIYFKGMKSKKMGEFWNHVTNAIEIPLMIVDSHNRDDLGIHLPTRTSCWLLVISAILLGLFFFWAKGNDVHNAKFQLHDMARHVGNLLWIR